MEQAPEDATLGALGLAGVFRETLRVVRSAPPGFPFLCGMVITLSLSLLAHVAVSPALFCNAVGTSDPGGARITLTANSAPCHLAEGAFLCIIAFQWIGSAAFCVFSVAPRYSGFAADADRDARDLREEPRFLANYLVSVFRGDSRLAARLVRTGPGVLARVGATTRDAFLVLLRCTVLAATAAVYTDLPQAVLLVAYSAGVAKIDTVWRVACVLSVQEDSASGFGALQASEELLDGGSKFWVAAAVFTTLESCAVAVQLAFGDLVVDNRMGLGVWLRVAVGAVMAVALWAAVVAGLVAQVVVYFVCKNSNSTTMSPTDVGQEGRAPPISRIAGSDSDGARSTLPI